MSVIVSMLRGVNVGGHNKIKMEDLRSLYADLGLRDAQTYVQSGNVVCRAPDDKVDLLPKRIGSRIQQICGFCPEIILRTTADLREVVARNPFASRRDIAPNKLIVVFFASGLADEAREKVLNLKVDPEEMRLRGREMYVYYPNGMGKSKFPSALIERTIKTPGTGRNWNTVMKLLEMAERLESAC